MSEDRITVEDILKTQNIIVTDTANKSFVGKENQDKQEIINFGRELLVERDSKCESCGDFAGEYTNLKEEKKEKELYLTVDGDTLEENTAYLLCEECFPDYDKEKVATYTTSGEKPDVSNSLVTTIKSFEKWMSDFQVEKFVKTFPVTVGIFSLFIGVLSFVYAELTLDTNAAVYTFEIFVTLSGILQSVVTSFTGLTILVVSSIVSFIIVSNRFQRNSNDLDKEEDPLIQFNFSTRVTSLNIPQSVVFMSLLLLFFSYLISISVYGFDPFTFIDQGGILLLILTSILIIILFLLLYLTEIMKTHRSEVYGLLKAEDLRLQADKRERSAGKDVGLIVNINDVYTVDTSPSYDSNIENELFTYTWVFLIYISFIAFSLSIFVAQYISIYTKILFTLLPIVTLVAYLLFRNNIKQQIKEQKKQTESDISTISDSAIEK